MPTALLVFEFIGTSELMIIAVVALIIFGPRKLPELGRSLGRSLGEFKRASEDFKRTWEYEVEVEQRSTGPTQTAGSVAEGTPSALPAGEPDAGGGPVARGSAWHEDTPAAGDAAAGEALAAPDAQSEAPPPRAAEAAPDAHAGPPGEDPTAHPEGAGGPREA